MQPLTLPPVAEGETYIGAIGDKNGDVYHLILLAGDNERAPQAAQIEWAKSIGGELPTKLEAAALFAHIKDKFEPGSYWTNDTSVDPDDPEDTAYAWCQAFVYGDQYGLHKTSKLRGVAVRRSFI